MEETKFWTKGKLIFIGIIFAIILIIIASIFIKRSYLRKQYIKLENQITSNASNYLKMEGITLKKGEWREINIRDIFKTQLVINKYSDDCKGYVIANADKKIENINYKSYINCGDIYTTDNYGTKLAKENKNTKKTQSQKDTIKPVIKLIGKKTMTIKLNKTFKDPGVVATDNVDGDITENVKTKGKVNIKEEGEYKLTYTVSDKAGNKISAIRTVIVKKDAKENKKDTTKPIISFKSDIVSTICVGEKIDINVNGTYGYSAYDDVDGDITKNVKISGNTGNINSEGEYKLTYTVSDKAGNKTSETRTFNVKNCNTSNTTVTEPTPTPAPTPVPTPSSNNNTNTSTNASNNSNNNSQTVNPPTVNQDRPVTDLQLTPSQTTIRVGESFIISVSYIPSSATNKSASFSSSNSSVATVDSNGRVTGVGSGYAQITVRAPTGNPAVVGVTVN